MNEKDRKFIEDLDSLLSTIEYANRRHNPKYKEYLDYYMSVVQNDKVRSMLKGTKHYHPTLNDIRDEKIDTIISENKTF